MSKETYEELLNKIDTLERELQLERELEENHSDAFFKVFTNIVKERDAAKEENAALQAENEVLKNKIARLERTLSYYWHNYRHL